MLVVKIPGPSLKFSCLAVVLGLFPLLPGAILAADPVVENVRFQQRQDGSRIADIWYDVSDADGDTLAISLRASDDEGLTWNFPVPNLTGDVGEGVLPGADRHITWDLGPMTDGLQGSGFRVRVTASDEGVLHYSHSPELVAITDFSSVDFNEPGVIEIFARADLVQLRGAPLWRGGTYGEVPVIQRMKEINPDIKVVAYVSSKVAALEEPIGGDLFYRLWWERTQPYFVSTTNGAIAQDWYTSRLINVLDPGCRQVMVSLVKEFQETSLNQFDGIYWDYFNTALWVPWNMELDGDPDMDGDGVGHWNDADELQGFRDAQLDLIQAVRDSLGQDFIQIFNGQRAYTDSTFAALADGVMYELFPTLHFPDPDMAHALDPDYTYSLFNMVRWVKDENGGPFVVLSNKDKNVFTDSDGQLREMSSGNVFRAVALMVDGCYSSWNSHAGSAGIQSFGWPEVEINLGPALGEPVLAGDSIRRNFRYGRVEIEMRSGSYPNAFHYRIWEMGQLVEMLAIPYVFP